MTESAELGLEFPTLEPLSENETVKVSPGSKDPAANDREKDVVPLWAFKAVHPAERAYTDGEKPKRDAVASKISARVLATAVRINFRVRDIQTNLFQAQLPAK